MSTDFDAWLRSLDVVEPEDRTGFIAPSVLEFLRELFDERGPVPLEEAEQAFGDREEALARSAVRLFLADLHRTTSLRPELTILRETVRSGVIVAYEGGFSTSGLNSLASPDVTVGLADDLRDSVMEDLWSPWPLCPADGGVLDAQVTGAEAVWHCSRGKHVVSRIGELPPP